MGNGSRKRGDDIRLRFDELRDVTSTNDLMISDDIRQWDEVGMPS
jgi:hypothetical protein